MKVLDNGNAVVAGISTKKGDKIEAVFAIEFSSNTVSSIKSAKVGQVEFHQYASGYIVYPRIG